MQPIDNQEWQSLSGQAQQEVCDFFLFVKQRHEQQVRLARHMIEQRHCFFQITVPI